MKDENKKKFIQVFAIALIMLLIASASYAYFAAQISDASSTDIIVNTSTVDSLTFETGEAISISATQSNFGSGAGNQSGSTYASATLVANNDTNEASAYYSIYLNIPMNEFEYTTSEEYAELILIVTDEDGNLVTSIDGLNYTSVTDGEGNTISGFDITGYTGSIAITEKHEIISYGIETDKWTVEVVFVNLSTDQSGNAGKELSAKLTIMQSGNTLQAVGSSSYSEKIWAYKDSVTKIVFDDTASTIDTYDYVYDITESGYCTYSGNEVYNFDNWSTDGVTESSCNTVYKVIDDDYIGYFDDSYTSYIIEYGSAVWDSEDNVCKTSDGNEVYTWYYENSPTEEQCNGTVYYDSYYDMYYVGIEYVGSGEWKSDNVSSIYAYLVNNGDSTYTVYIESDAPVLGNEDMSYWFSEFTLLESIEGLDKLITSNVTNMRGMFYGSSSLTTLDLGSWDTSNVTDMSSLFSGRQTGPSNYNYMSLKSINLDGWDTSNVTNMGSMFQCCIELENIDLSSFDTSRVTNMDYMFLYCTSLATLDLSNFNTPSLVSMYEMFYHCNSLSELDVSNFDTSNVTSMSQLFIACRNLTSLDLSSWDTSNVTEMIEMFSGCSILTSLDLSNADFSNVTTKYSMFYNVPSSITVTVKDSDAYDFITTRLSESNGGTVVIA